MKKYFPVLIVLLMSSFCFAELEPPINMYDKIPDILSKGFFSIPWGSKMPGGYLIYKANDGQGIEIYTFNRTVSFHGVPIQEVLFGFYKERFCSGSLRFLARENYEKIKEFLKNAEGGTFLEKSTQGKMLACSWAPDASQPYRGSVTLIYSETAAQGDLMFTNLKQDSKKEK